MNKEHFEGKIEAKMRFFPLRATKNILLKYTRQQQQQQQQTKQNKTKQYKTIQNNTKQNKTKTKQNKTKQKQDTLTKKVL